MKTQKYSVNPHMVETILSWINAGEIAIPEIQRPFVWNKIKVRDLLDSLYAGYPIGYLIVWRNPNVKLKDGSLSEGKKILIDGQQRVLALAAAILGQEIINEEYRKERVIISFNPLTKKFEVMNPAIGKDSAWIKDISKLMSGEERLSTIVREYCEINSNVEQEVVEDALEDLKDILKKQVGYIELKHDLSIEEVTDIFIRINSKGVPLGQADFAMSKIASNEAYGGSTLRKCIDYFCHSDMIPEFYLQIPDFDEEFSKTEHYSRMRWIKNESDDLYRPDYRDMLRVAFTSEFGRGKLADLVSLLSGRNFETKKYEEEISKQSFESLYRGVTNFINESNFKRFLMIIKSAGFIHTDYINSQNALNFAYVLYLKLKTQGYAAGKIEKYVSKWFVLSTLTGRYSGSPESTIDYDIRNISTKKFEEYLQEVESAELSEAFWKVALAQNLEISNRSNPNFNVFLAAQIKSNDKGFLSKDITVRDLISHKGDLHHIFPKEYLKGKDMGRAEYNQIANYAYTQSEINIKIGKKPPKEYFAEVKEQCESGNSHYGNITSWGEVLSNLDANAIPRSIVDMDAENYDSFLKERRELMAQKIFDYYASLGE